LSSSSDIARAANEWLNGKIYKVFLKRNVFLYDPAGLSALLENISLRIGELNLRPDIRSHTLIITVKERNPAGFWCSSDELCYILDENGIIYEKIAKPGGSGALLVMDAVSGEKKPGERVLPKNWVEYLNELRIRLQPEFWILKYEIEPESFGAGYVRASVTGISVPNSSWDLFANVSTKDDAASLAGSIKMIMNQEIKNNAERLLYIDMRVPGRAYYKLR